MELPNLQHSGILGNTWFKSYILETPACFGDISLTKAFFKKLFEKEIFIKIQPISLFPIFYKFKTYSKVVCKSIIDLDNIIQAHCKHELVNPFTLRVSLESVVCYSHTFESII